MKIIILITAFLIVSISYGQSCSQAPTKASCDFYSECLEDNYNCQNTDYQYPIEYGDRFCNEFELSRDNLTLKGKVWIDRTMICLQKVLFDEFLGDDLNRNMNENFLCKDISKVAFRSHHECYVRPTGNIKDGICPLWKDYKQIFEIGRPWEAVGSIYESEVKAQVKQTAKTCMLYWMGFKQNKSFKNRIPVREIIKDLKQIIKKL